MDRPDCQVSEALFPRRSGEKKTAENAEGRRKPEHGEVWEDGRHEMLNGTNRDEAVGTPAQWLEEMAAARRPA
jgi:alpha-beta hydrolase superfamily lysophospholipase